MVAAFAGGGSIAAQSAAKKPDVNAGQAALDQLQAAVKKSKEAPDRKAKRRRGSHGRRTTLMATLRPDSAKARLEVYRTTVARLGEAKKQNEQEKSQGRERRSTRRSNRRRAAATIHRRH